MKLVMYKAFFIAAIMAAAIIIIASPATANTVVSSNTYSQFPQGINTTSICLNGSCQSSLSTGTISGLNSQSIPVARNSTTLVSSNFSIDRDGILAAFYGRNSTTDGNSTSIAVVNIGQVDDGTGAIGRAGYQIWIVGSSGAGLFNANDLPLQLLCHSNLTQDRECTMYSNTRNGTFSGKIFDWYWGPDWDRTLYLKDVKRMTFKEGDGSENGFYGNLTTIPDAINTEKNRLWINVDVNGNDTTGEEVAIGRNSADNPSVLANFSWTGITLNSNINHNGVFETTGNLYINGSGTGVWFGGVSDFSNGVFEDTNDQTIFRYGSSSDQLVGNGITNDIAPAVNNSVDLGNSTHLFRNVETINVNATAIVYTPQICLNGNCQTSWPSGSGGLAGQYFGGYTYLVWRNGSTYVAQNVTGSVLTTSASAHLVINAAINNITTTESAGGGRVQLSCQEFLLTDSIRINKSMITLEGCGSGTKMNVSGFTGKPMINVTGNSVVHVTIRNLHMNGQSASGVTAIYLNTPYQQGDTEHLVENIKVWEAGRYAVQIEGDTRVVQLNNIYSRTAGIDAFRIEGSDHKFDLLTSEGAGCNGFYLAGGNIHMMNSKAFGNGATGGNTCAGMTIYGRLTTVVGSEVQDNYHCGVYIDDPETYNVLLSSNVYDTNGRAGSVNNASVCINNAHDIIVTASQFINRDGARNQSYAFKVTGTAENMSFVSNDYSYMGITPYSFSTTANRLNATIIGNTGQNKTSQIEGITITTLSGSGNDYACLDPNGALFRSNAAC